MARTYIETLHLMNNLGNGTVLIDGMTEEDLLNITTALEKQIPVSRIIRMRSESILGIYRRKR